MLRACLVTAGLAAFAGCTTTPPGAFGAATFSINSATPKPASAIATPVYISDGDGSHVGYDITLYSTNIPPGSPCDGSYTAEEYIELDVVTLQHGQGADLAGETLPVTTPIEDPSFTHSHDYVYVDAPGSLAPDPDSPTNGIVKITGDDGWYIDATYDVNTHVYNNGWDGDTSVRPIELAGTLHAGICSGY